MRVLLWSDKTRYGELIENLKRGAYKRIDEYTETVTCGYEILIITSRYIGMSTHKVNRLSFRTKCGGRINLGFCQNGRRENIGRHRDQENTAPHGNVVPGKIGLQM